MEVLIVDFPIAVIAGVRDLCGDILVERASKSHVDELRSTADAQHGFSLMEKLAHELLLVEIANPVSVPLRPQGLLAVALRRHIGSALKDEPVELSNEVSHGNRSSRLGRG